MSTKYQFYTRNQENLTKRILSNFAKWQIARPLKKRPIFGVFENKIDFSINQLSSQLVSVKSCF